MKYIPSLFQIIQDYDALLVDQWGVLHNGKYLHPKTLVTLQKLQDMQRTVLIVTNSSRDSQVNANLMQTLGIDSSLYTGIATSGDALYDNLKHRPAPYDTLGQNVYVMPWADEQTVIDSLHTYTKVQTIDDADFLLVTGVIDQTLQMYPSLLQQAIDKNLVMVIGNPDIKSVNDRGDETICPGMIMNMYKKLGGKVWVNGKPDKTFYEGIIKKWSLQSKRILCIGDSLYHDIKGGQSIHADTLFITQGIHQKDLPLPLNHKDVIHFMEQHVQPTYYIGHFC